jgi:hypothetical protein
MMLAGFMLCLSVGLPATAGAQDASAAARGVLTKATQIQRQLEATSRSAVAGSAAVRAKVPAAQARLLRDIAHELARNPRSAAALRNWQTFIASVRPAPREVEGLVQWVVGEASLRSSARLAAEIKTMEERLNSVGDDAQLANVDMQNWLPKQQQLLQMMSNISKSLHDTAAAIIRNMKG